ncbi:Lrp/AsnC family transcriptional regulator [Mucilaginibacter sp. AW1-3]
MINGKLDEIDTKILAHLQGNARMPNVALGKLVHLSSGPVQTRIDKLEEAGYIQGYHARVDRHLAGQPVLVVLHVRLKHQTKELLLDFEQFAMAIPQVQACLHVTGKWDFILQVTAASPQAYYVFVMDRICDRPNVAKVETSMVMKEAKCFGPLVL